ncbi:MAG: hypothetical protein AW07_02109 [Candidatus Accumulibacter sp. SK-11]|nr:MAG: hypothetical protein AW07_02109 [Candidatus Accumulibacter sp. SK-11]
MSSDPPAATEQLETLVHAVCGSTRHSVRLVPVAPLVSWEHDVVSLHALQVVPALVDVRCCTCVRRCCNW